MPLVAKKLIPVLLVLCGAWLLPLLSYAATLSISPGTGVYKTGQTFTVNLVVNTTGASINAADGTISFNPRELSVVSVNRASSIFNLWTAEPAFSNSAGTITFSGGVPTGYTGGGGNVMTATFRSLTSGTARVTISGASVLAADGRGTNVLTNMSGGTYTLAAVDSQPAPEVIVEYVPPANTPAAPKITSPTHADQTLWYANTTATLNWTLPSDVTAVRTLLDDAAVSVPTKVYETPIRTITLDTLDQGISYFHIQFKNADGWGRVGHYRLAVDTDKPDTFLIERAEDTDLSNPIQSLRLRATDSASPIASFSIQIDGGEPFVHTAKGSTTMLTLPALEPGPHTIVAEAVDGAGNTLTGSIALTILSFDKPVITEYPAELSAGVIPVIRGTTRPNAVVTLALTTPLGETIAATTTSTEAGIFTFIPEKPFGVGVYKLVSVATDQYGAQSAPSDEIKILVKESGYIAFGTFLISVFSIIIPLIGLAVLGWITLMYSWHKIRTLRAKILRESGEATAVSIHEFAAILLVLDRHEQRLIQSRKTQKLTAAEAALFNEIRAVVTNAEKQVEKEVADVTALVTDK